MIYLIVVAIILFIIAIILFVNAFLHLECDQRLRELSSSNGLTHVSFWSIVSAISGFVLLVISFYFLWLYFTEIEPPKKEEIVEEEKIKEE
uniref:Transmembrane protein n=1 Tax=Pithovirus LCDPAC02 TaxID=2506601 RepID=A0A481YQN7_9VIRU|nr:MAG: hypothetical protein LCDPAC02_02640 [Pithovirus LCDPAC02]